MYDMYDYGYGYNPLAGLLTMAGGALIVLVLGVIIGLVLHFTFLSEKNEGRYTGNLGKLYDFLTFRRLCIESILRLFYIIGVVLLTGFSILMIFSGFRSLGIFAASFFGALLLFFGGNLLLRITYEMSLLTVLICKNVIQINRKMKASSPVDMPPLSGRGLAEPPRREEPSMPLHREEPPVSPRRTEPTEPIREERPYTPPYRETPTEPAHKTHKRPYTPPDDFADDDMGSYFRKMDDL